jgi:phage/conjugal plasmid C-4 type zinc finger TraR family protein
MTDVFDRASDLEQQQREDALAEARYRSERQRARPSAEECQVCGGRIPVARRRAVPGVQTCVHCQEELEMSVVSGGD